MFAGLWARAQPFIKTAGAVAALLAIALIPSRLSELHALHYFDWITRERALWVFCIVLVAYVAWIDLRPFLQAWWRPSTRTVAAFDVFEDFSGDVRSSSRRNVGSIEWNGERTQLTVEFENLAPEFAMLTARCVETAASVPILQRSDSRVTLQFTPSPRDRHTIIIEIA